MLVTRRFLKIIKAYRALNHENCDDDKPFLLPWMRVRDTNFYLLVRLQTPFFAFFLVGLCLASLLSLGAPSALYNVALPLALPSFSRKHLYSNQLPRAASEPILYVCLEMTKAGIMCNESQPNRRLDIRACKVQTFGHLVERGISCALPLTELGW